MQAHISKMTQTCFFHLRCLREVRRLLGLDVTANLVCTITAWLQQCSARWTAVVPLQCIVNAGVRLLYGLRAHDHVSVAAIKLHWLPIEARVQYKLCSSSLDHHWQSSTSQLVHSQFLHSQVVSPSFTQPRDQTCKFPGHAWSLESVPSAWQPPRHGTTCHCTACHL